MVPLTPAALQPGGSREVRNGLFYCSHTYKLALPAERVLAALQGDWDTWWTMGKRLDVRVDDQGYTRWRFIPFRPTGMMVWFNIVMAPPRVENGAAGQPERVVLELELDGACRGPARYEVYASADGGSFLRGAWDGVRPKGWRAMATGMFGFMHVMVESRAVARLGRLSAAR
jgi:hypothetical protein